jgi:peptidase E
MPFLKVLFVPYALTDRDEYAAAAKKPFEDWGFIFEVLKKFKKMYVY